MEYGEGKQARSEIIAMYQYLGINVHIGRPYLNDTKVLINSNLKFEHDMGG